MFWCAFEFEAGSVALSYAESGPKRVLSCDVTWGQIISGDLQTI